MASLAIQHPSVVEITPLAFLSVVPSRGRITASILSSAIEEVLRIDDVLSRAWLSNLFIYSTNNTPSILDPLAIQIALQRYGVRQVYVHSAITHKPKDLDIRTFRTDTRHPDLRGPYLARPYPGGVELRPVYRLYPDVYRTFIYGIYPANDGSGRYKRLNRVDDHGRVQIPIPSRLYATEGDKYLKGTRVAIKGEFFATVSADRKIFTISRASRLRWEATPLARRMALWTELRLQYAGWRRWALS